jgi:Protein of unknown function (DUF2442)
MVPKIISVKPLDGYRIEVKFDDGVNGIYELSHLAGKGVFTLWDVDGNFNKVNISEESGAVTWPGDLDIDTLNMYCNIKGISPEHYIQSLKAHAPNL